MALGIYIHIPFCKSKCDYCSFVSSSDDSRAWLYKEKLIKDITQFSLKRLKVDSIYLGGGTPSVLPRGYITEILDAVKSAFLLTTDCEITSEANPDSATEEYFEEIKRAGVNRVSLGLQSCDDKILKEVNRPHSFKDFFTAMTFAKNSGIHNISADLMLGLPNDTLHSFQKSLAKVLEFDLKHLSLYSLKVEEGTALYNRSFVADEDLQTEMYDFCVRELQQNGYNRYEVSNFCQEDFLSRHNMKYWTREEYVGFGVAAHSLLNNVRYENTVNLSKYILNAPPVKTILSQEDIIEESIMLGLRTAKGLDCNALKENTSYDLMIEKKDKIAKLTKLKLIERCGSVIRLTQDAYYVMNSVIVELL